MPIWCGSYHTDDSSGEALPQRHRPSFDGHNPFISPRVLVAASTLALSQRFLLWFNGLTPHDSVWRL